MWCASALLCELAKPSRGKVASRGREEMRKEPVREKTRVHPRKAASYESCDCGAGETA